VVTDVTSGLGVLSVAGPRARDLLAPLSDADLDDRAFPFAAAREIDVGWATALALRVSFTGELGWELYVPVESLVVLYDQLVAAGAASGLRHAGYHALDGLRAEKGYRVWGLDMGPADTPFEAGLEATVAPGKAADFVGRAALERRAAEPAVRRLVHVRLVEPEPLLYHGESVRFEGRLAGRVTSGAYGHTLGAAVGLAFVEGEPALLDRLETEGRAQAEVEIAGRRVAAELSRRPFFDPDGRRLRGDMSDLESGTAG